MRTVLLVIHILIAFGLVGTILMQRSEGGGLGIGGGGGGGGGMGGLIGNRSTANLLTRVTAILAAAFFITSLGLTLLPSRSEAPRSILDVGAPAAPAAGETPAAPR
ncbi:MAG: preprotein translocase subunit SecG [Alphaproteobacteria bacterium]|nr:preprotein translocase subunit SecG [Alphaproteobacteria bacterium]